MIKFMRQEKPENARLLLLIASVALSVSNVSRSLMVSIHGRGVWDLLFFVEPGVKVDDRYDQDVLLKQQILPVVS